MGIIWTWKLLQCCYINLKQAIVFCLFVCFLFLFVCLFGFFFFFGFCFCFCFLFFFVLGGKMGVYSSRKSELFPPPQRWASSAKSFPKFFSNFLTVAFYRCLFDIVCDDFFLGGGSITVPNAYLVRTGGVWGGCAPWEAGKFCIFEIGIVQFDEYFWVQV